MAEAEARMEENTKKGIEILSNGKVMVHIVIPEVNSRIICALYQDNIWFIRRMHGLFYDVICLGSEDYWFVDYAISGDTGFKEDDLPMEIVPYTHSKLKSKLE